MTKKNKDYVSPIITMIFLIILSILISSLLAFLNLDSSKTMIVNGTLETSIVVVKNILTKDGLINFFSNIITNFNLLEPMILLILSIMMISIGKNSGLFKHLFKPLKKIKFKFVVFLVILVSILSTIIGDYSYIILLPLVAILYQYLEKNPMLGIITVFLGISLGYATGIFYNYNDFVLGTLTQVAANINVDATYKFNLNSNFYIVSITMIILAFLLSFVIDKYLSKKMPVEEIYTDELITSSKALFISQIFNFICIIGVIILILPQFGGILLDNKQEAYIAKLFSTTSPFYESFIFIILFIIALTSTIYGYISKNFKNSHDFSFALTKEFDNVGYIFILLFFYSILMGIINWTNLGVFVTNKLIILLSTLEFSGIPLIITTFIFVIIMSILMPGSLEKWSLISPLLIPLFMRANISPNFTQFVFSAADSVGKILTPCFIYFIIMLGLIQKYNIKENKISLFSIIKIALPIIIIITLFWLIVLIIWYLSGLPLGIGTYATM